MRPPRLSGPGPVALLLLVCLALVHLLSDPGDPGGSLVPGSGSVLNRDGSGTRALYLAAAGAGVRVGTSGAHPRTLGPATGPLVVALPASAPWETVVHLARMAGEGGRLLLALPRDGEGWEGAVPGVARRRRLAAPGTPRAAAGQELRTPAVTTLLALDPDSLPSGAEWLVEVDAPGGPWPWIARVPLGGGEVIVAADRSFLDNDHLRDDGAALLAVRLVERISRGERVSFYEQPHGMMSEGSMMGVLWRTLCSTPAGHGALQVAAAALILLAAGWPRLGRVRRTVEPPRRAGSEHVDAVAGLLGGAGPEGWGVVGGLLRTGLRRRAGLAGEGAPATRAGELGRRLAWDRPADAAALAAAAEGLERARDPAALAAALATLDGAVARRPGTGVARRRGTAAG